MASLAEYDCIICGAGHAGCEAAVCLARLGLKTLLITGNIDRIGYLSCNPAIGGIAKGHLVREIDALGGMMGKWADASGIQFRTLNLSRGPAVRSTRAQMDRIAYSLNVKKTIFSTPNLDVWQDQAIEILEKNGRVDGIRTIQNKTFFARHLVLTPGTFLEGKIHIGLDQFEAGRMGDPPVKGLSASLRSFGIILGRLKTGTTPRLARSSINYSSLEEQVGHLPLPKFSFSGHGPVLPQITCHVTWTNSATHAIIRSGFDRSPLFQGAIKGTGARYCPSIEDKVNRFAERERHQIFLEPEGLDSGEVYCNGISTSLPIDVQEKMIRSIRGLENAKMIRPGYAIEYDYANPVQLFPTLESRNLPGLWQAGQINGTSGYEEAAAQGLWAALNIAAKEKDLPPFLPDRSEAYMAVLVDDLVREGTEEPYRMFTSRAEYRLLLREDNADCRLTPLGRKYGLVDDEAWRDFEKRRNHGDRLSSLLAMTKYGHEDVISGLGQKTFAEILARPDFTLDKICGLIGQSPDSSLIDLANCLEQCDIDTRKRIESEIKYAGYLDKQKALIRRSSKLENSSLPQSLDYSAVPGLSREVEEKLSRLRPVTLGQARRISGITPAAIACLEIYLHKNNLLAVRETE